MALSSKPSRIGGDKKNKQPQTNNKNTVSNSSSAVAKPTTGSTGGSTSNVATPTKPIANTGTVNTPTKPIANTGTVNTTTKATTTTNTAAPVTNNAPITVPNQYTRQYGTDVQSKVVTDAFNYLNSVMNNRPGAFQSSYESQLNDIYNKIMNRDPFEYDLNTDMLYQQAKDQYTALGKMAMQDTMGQAAALTGGYGNSYANTAGYQAYQGYLQELNNNIPEYYQMALDQYNQDTNNLYNQFATTGDLYNTEYGQYRDKVSDWYNDLSNAYNRYADEKSLDYNSYTNAQNLGYQAFVDAQNLAYQKERDAISDAQWQKEYALNSATSSAAPTYSKLSDDNYELLEMLGANGENETIERWLTNWVEAGKISEAEAQRLMDVYYTDEKEAKTVGNGKYTGAGLPRWHSLILNPDGSLK